MNLGAKVTALIRGDAAAILIVAVRRTSILLVLVSCLAWLSQPVRGGALEPFLARLAGNPVEKAPTRVSALFAWDEEEATRGRARVLIRRAPETDFDRLRPGIALAAPTSTWEGEAGDLGQVVAAWGDLPRIAELPGVAYVFRSPKPVLCREQRSEGIDTMMVPAFHTTGHHGAGARIAILDLGFDGYERFLGGEIGGDVVARSFFRSPAGHGDITGGGIDHGVACAEIVHDVAPDARLYLVNVETLVDLQSAVDWLIDEHVSVINHSVGWYFGGLNGHGPINDMADNAARKDILWVNAAGNEAERHTWATARDADGDQLLEFDEVGDETLDFTHLAAGDTMDLVLLWDDWPRSRWGNLELELTDAQGEILATTEDQAPGNPYAIRILSWGSDGEAVAVRVRSQGDVSGMVFHVFRVGQGVRMEEHMRRDRSLLVPADSPSVLAVGATYWRDLTLDSYSSRGGLEEEDIVKPELCGPVAVTTATYGQEGFRGTSAAAPHVAGAAGLIASAGIQGGLYDLQWTREEILLLLSGNALPLPDIEPLAWGEVRVPFRHAAVRGREPVILNNPASGLVRWNEGSGEVEIVNIAGQILARTDAPYWQGLDRQGRPVPTGIYWLRSRSTGASTRFVWLGR